MEMKDCQRCTSTQCSSEYGDNQDSRFTASSPITTATESEMGIQYVPTLSTVSSMSDYCGRNSQKGHQRTPPLWTNETALPLIRKVIHHVQNHFNVKPLALALAVGSYLHDICGMEVKLITEPPIKQNIPPSWFKGLIIVRANRQEQEIFVDCDFYSKFLVARPTHKYISFLNTAVPNIYVGTQDKLEKDLEIVVEVMQECLVEGGLHIAPWRTSDRLKHMFELCITSSEFYQKGISLLEAVTTGLQGNSPRRGYGTHKRSHSHSLSHTHSRIRFESETSSSVFTAITIRSTVLQSGLTLTDQQIPASPTSPAGVSYSSENVSEDDFNTPTTAAIANNEFEKCEVAVAEPSCAPSGISMLMKGNSLSSSGSSSLGSHFRVFKLFSTNA